MAAGTMAKQPIADVRVIAVVCIIERNGPPMAMRRAWRRGSSNLRA